MVVTGFFCAVMVWWAGQPVESAAIFDGLGDLSRPQYLQTFSKTIALQKLLPSGMYAYVRNITHSIIIKLDKQQIKMSISYSSHVLNIKCLTF